MQGFELEKVKVVLWVQNMSRARDFYGNTFGLEVAEASDHWSELRHGDSILALHGGNGEGTGPTNLSLQVSDLEQAIAKAESAGAVLVDPPVDRPGEPICLARIRDPEGNEIAITEYVGR